MTNSTISMSEDSNDLVEKLRKKIPRKKIPTQKATVDLIIKYVSNHETEFITWVENSKVEEK